MYQSIYRFTIQPFSHLRLGLILLSFVVHSPSVLAADWLHFGYDAQYTSYNPIENTINIDNISQLQRQWGIGCDDGWFSVISRAPAIFNDKLYTSGAGNRLTAYDAKNGQMLWQFGDGNAGWAPQPVVSDDGIVFYMEGSYPTYLYAVDADSGNMLWEAPIGFDLGFNNTALVTVDEANNVVYLVEYPFMGDGKLFALNKQTGEIVWYKSRVTDGVGFEGDYVLLSGGKIFVEGEVKVEHFWEDRMLCIDASSQEIEIIFEKPEEIEFDNISKYTLCNDKLIVTFSDRDDVFESISTLVVYDVTSQAVIWQKEYSTAITGTIACNTTKNVIYVPTEPYLYALDAATGQEIWKYQGYDAIYNPSIANGIVYFISDTNMYAVDENTGEKVFSYPLGNEGNETTQVAINDGMLYFSGNGGTCDLFALAETNIVDLVVNFGDNAGLWLWLNNSTWDQLHSLSPESMITGNLDGSSQDEIIIDFGPSYGIWLWMNNSNWAKLHSLSPESMVVGNIDGSGQDDVIIDFGSDYGIWMWMNNSDWVQLHSLSPESMVMGDINGSTQDDVIIDFGPQYGIWVWMNNSTWDQLHTISPEGMITGDLDSNGQDDVIIDFGSAYGIYRWMNNSTWEKLHSLSPDSMVTGNIEGLSAALYSDTAISQAPAGSEDNTMILPEANAISLPKAEATDLPQVAPQKLPK